MYRLWGFERLKLRMLMLLLVLSLFEQNLSFSSHLNNEGLALLRFKQRVVNDPFGALSSWKEIDGEIDPCSWKSCAFCGKMITGRIPYSVLADWASDYLKRDRPLKEMVDPSLKFFQEDDVEKLFQVIKTCVDPDPKEITTMRGIAAKLKEITAMEQLQNYLPFGGLSLKSCLKNQVDQWHLNDLHYISHVSTQQREREMKCCM